MLFEDYLQKLKLKDPKTCRVVQHVKRSQKSNDLTNSYTLLLLCAKYETSFTEIVEQLQEKYLEHLSQHDDFVSLPSLGDVLAFKVSLKASE